MAAVQPEPWFRALITTTTTTKNNNLQYVPHQLLLHGVAFRTPTIKRPPHYNMALCTS
jgi:hypothetical protein